jgi:LysM repeat protein
MFVDKTASLSRKIGKVVGQGRGSGFPLPNQLNNINMENEETPKSISMKSALVVVVTLHAVALFGLIYFSSVKSSQAENDKKFLTEDKYAGVEATPTPTPVPVPMDRMPEKQSWPTENVKQELKTWPNTKKAIPVVQSNSHYTKEYVVKRGDTFNSIVRKYKLNADKLKQINNIKNENTIQVGQKLKLM